MRPLLVRFGANFAPHPAQGALGMIAKQQNERVRKVEARNERLQREDELQEQRAYAKAKRAAKKKNEDAAVRFQAQPGLFYIQLAVSQFTHFSMESGTFRWTRRSLPSGRSSR